MWLSPLRKHCYTTFVKVNFFFQTQFLWCPSTDFLIIQALRGTLLWHLSVVQVQWKRVCCMDYGSDLWVYSRTPTRPLRCCRRSASRVNRQPSYSDVSLTSKRTRKTPGHLPASLVLLYLVTEYRFLLWGSSVAWTPAKNFTKKLEIFKRYFCFSSLQSLLLRRVSWVSTMHPTGEFTMLS